MSRELFLQTNNCRTGLHVLKAAKRGISNEYVVICTGIQHDGKAVAETVNCAKPSGKKLCGIFGTHIADLDVQRLCGKMWKITNQGLGYKTV